MALFYLFLRTALFVFLVLSTQSHPVDIIFVLEVVFVHLLT